MLETVMHDCLRMSRMDLYSVYKYNPLGGQNAEVYMIPVYDTYGQVIYAPTRRLWSTLLKYYLMQTTARLVSWWGTRAQKDMLWQFAELTLAEVKY